MLLAVDVGNTAAAAVVFRGQRIVRRVRIPTPAAWTERSLSSLLPCGPARHVDAAIVSSVVPRLDRGLAAAIRRRCAQRPLFLDHRTPTGLVLRIDRPSQLGADRIADCAGALALYPPPLIVIDSGTATTFDLVDREGAYCGGCIFPGVAIAMKSLAANTAKLENVSYTVPASAVGRNTRDNIRAGIHFGYIGALEHLIALYRKELGTGTTVVATGGLIRRFRGRVRGIDAFVPDLIFLGLRRIHERLAAGE